MVDKKSPEKDLWDLTPEEVDTAAEEVFRMVELRIANLQETCRVAREIQASTAGCSDDARRVALDGVIMDVLGQLNQLDRRVQWMVSRTRMETGKSVHPKPRYYAQFTTLVEAHPKDDGETLSEDEIRAGCDLPISHIEMEWLSSGYVWSPRPEALASIARFFGEREDYFVSSLC